MELTQDYLKYLLRYDPATGIFTNLITRCGRCISGNIAGSIITTPSGKKYRYIGINKKSYLAHRLAFLYMVGEQPKECTDHLNGDGTDNRWDNLRIVTKRENALNQRLPRNNKSGCIGVRYDETTLRWHAKIAIGGLVEWLGSHADKRDAIAARRAAEGRYGYHRNHGERRLL